VRTRIAPATETLGDDSLFVLLVRPTLEIFDGFARRCWRSLCCLISLRHFDNNAADVSGVLTGAVEFGCLHFEPIKEIAGLEAGFRTTDAEDAVKRR
jgi:hypothetical protein